jgi:hypothetical protein
LFHGPVRVPDEASNGNAKVTLSFPEWKEGKVAPASFEIPIIEPEPKKPEPTKQAVQETAQRK